MYWSQHMLMLGGGRTFRLLAELKTRNRKGYVPAAAFIIAYLGLGDYDEAFCSVQRAYEEGPTFCNFSTYIPSLIPCAGTPP